MIKTHFFALILIFTVGLLGYYFSSFKSPSLQTSGEQKTAINDSNNKNCIPAFQDGGGPYYKPNSPFREEIAPEKNNGEKLTVTGKVLKNDCETPVADAVLDFWQANESGSYEDIWYRGQVRTDNNGNYKLKTVVPKGYGEGTGYRPPHIHFKVFLESKEIITSQIFFPEVKDTPGFNNAYIMKVDSSTKDGIVTHQGMHNIILP